MKKNLRKAVCLMLLLSLSLTVCGCGSKPPALDTVRETYTELIEASYEINGILFGDSVKVYERGSEEAESIGIYNGVPQGYYNYEFLTDENKYRSEDEIRRAAEKVYSRDYIAPVLDTCFDGFMDDTSSEAVQPKFLTYTGMLMLNTEYTVYVNSERRYDCSTMEIVKPSNAKIVNVALDALDGGRTTRVQLTFVLQDGEWRLDGPTY